MAADANLRPDIGCPHCGLVCDDLTIATREDGTVEPVAGACWLSRERYADLQAAPPTTPMFDGCAAAHADVVARAAALLGASRAPVFVVAGDVAATRAALRLADRLGGVIDHPDSDALYRTLGVLQDTGGLTTTLSEIRNRADFVLVVGPDPVSALPRFYERCVAPTRTLFSDPGGLVRTVVRVGPAAHTPLPEGSPAIEEIDCPAERLPEAVAFLRAFAAERAPARAQSHELAPALADVAARLRAARYGLVVWAPGLVERAVAGVLAHELLGLVRDVTRTTRASLLALGGTANLVGVSQVCTWQTGFPLRTRLGRDGPAHDPHLFSARRMIAAGEADAVVWVSAFDTRQRMPPESNVPTILLAPPGAAAAARVAAYLPVGVPGLDHGGQVFRADGVVALRLHALRAAPALAGAADVLAELDAGTQSREARA